MTNLSSIAELPALSDELERRVRSWADRPDLHEAEEIAKIAHAFDTSSEQVFHSSAEIIATRYADNSLDFSVCDAAITHLFSAALIEGFNFHNSMFYEIYLAFDAGEYHRAPDRSDSPEHDYTRPLIAAIMSKYQLGQQGRSGAA